MLEGPQGQYGLQFTRLEKGEKPPDGASYVLLDVATPGPYVHSIGDGGLALVQGPFISLVDAVDAAERHAAERHVSTIYTRGI